MAMMADVVAIEVAMGVALLETVMVSVMLTVTALVVVVVRMCVVLAVVVVAMVAGTDRMTLMPLTGNCGGYGAADETDGCDDGRDGGYAGA